MSGGRSGMKVGDRVKIKAYGGGYWKGKITKISDRHTWSDGRESAYLLPIAAVHEIGGSRLTVVNESDLKRKFRGFVEK